MTSTISRTPNMQPASRSRKRNSKQPQDDPRMQHLGIGIDTGRYGHHVSFLREDKQRIAAARLSSLTKIPFLLPEKAAEIQKAAKSSISMLSSELDRPF